MQELVDDFQFVVSLIVTMLFRYSQLVICYYGTSKLG